MSDETVAVVITSHNYGRFLTECIESVRSQTRQPNQIVVIADSCTDNTTEYAIVHGVPYACVKHKNCYLSRKEGLDLTESDYVIFLDADDILYPRYIAEALEIFKHNIDVGIVTSSLAMFGLRHAVVNHDPCPIEQRNWIHAGSMVRRTALIGSGAYEQPPTGLDSHEDWYVWRAVMRAGWRAVSTGQASYGYRQHADSLMHGTMRHGSYFTRASLAMQPITLVLPICREKYFAQLSSWVNDQKQNGNELIVIDSADNTDLRARIASFIYYSDFTTATHVKRPLSEGLADMNRSLKPGVYLKVQQRMTQIYHYLRRANNEYIMIIEDDVLPPTDAITQLLQSMDHDVAGVSAVVPCKQRRAYQIAGQNHISQLSLEKQEGIDQLAFSGFGCLLLRRSAMLQAAPFNSTETGNYDIEFWREVLQKGWRLLVNNSVRCQHGEIVC